jgi:hypothetical protein
MNALRIYDYAAAGGYSISEIMKIDGITSGGGGYNGVSGDIPLGLYYKQIPCSKPTLFEAANAHVIDDFLFSDLFSILSKTTTRKNNKSYQLKKTIKRQ